MAATDIKSVLELLRTKVHGADSSTSLDELNNMVKAAQLAHTPMIRHYDSDGSLPTATTTEQRLAFITSTGSIKMNNGRRWETTSSTASEGGGSGGRTNAQGVVSGYTSGGWGPGMKNVIDKYPFTSNGNATDVGDLAVTTNSGSGHSSSTYGYVVYGMATPSQTTTNGMERFSLTVDGNGSALTAQLTENRNQMGGVSSDDNGYVISGATPTYSIGTPVIDKFSFTSDANSSAAGNLPNSYGRRTGNNSTTHGYASGGHTPPGGVTQYLNNIEKFPFASDDNATDVGDLALGRQQAGPSGSNSSTHGYVAGGQSGWPGVTINNIDKWSFAVDGNATDVGDLEYTTSYVAATSSTTDGYVATGTRDSGPPYNINNISKFPFASDAGSTDVGDVTLSRVQTHPAQI